MPRALFLNVPARGHVQPTLSLVEALTEAGHDVLYFNRSDFADLITGSGATFKEYQGRSRSLGADYPDNFVTLAARLLQATRFILEDNLDTFRELAPDYILFDSLAPWGPITAAELEVPSVSSWSTFVFHRELVSEQSYVRRATWGMIRRDIPAAVRAYRTANALRRTYRGAHQAVDCLTNFGDLNLVYTSRLFQPRSDHLGDEFLFLGPPSVYRPPADSGGGYSWRSDRPHVYVALGTMVHDPAFRFAGRESIRRLFDDLLRLFAEEDLEVVMATGEHYEPGVPVPGNVELFAFAPQISILDSCDVFVTHAGMNSVNEALSFGVPMVLLPFQVEERVVADRVTELGAGTIVAEEWRDAPHIAGAVREVLENESYRSAAARLGESLDMPESLRQAVEAIEQLLPD